MPVPSTRDGFLDLVRKSGLVAETALHQLPDGDDLRVLADTLVRNGALTRFQAREILAGRYKGFVLDRYRVLEPIGVGGMGTVYLCEHVEMGHRVAMKVLPVGKAADPTMLARFRREARAIASLNHPNVVRAFDINCQRGLHYLILEYVEGVSLQELVQRIGPLPPARAAHFIAQAALGLQHIHDNALVHRDIKPANLLLDRTGCVKILDLGLARFRDHRDDHLTRQIDKRSVLGTADYIAPEQSVHGEAADVRSDIYSLGASLYYLLTGRPPFDGSFSQKLLWHQLRDPEPLSKFRTDVPMGMEAVLRKMMTKRPEDRFQEAIEVVDALSEWTTTPVPPPTDEEMPSTTRLRSVATPTRACRTTVVGSPHRVRVAPLRFASRNRLRTLGLLLLSALIGIALAVGWQWLWLE